MDFCGRCCCFAFSFSTPTTFSLKSFNGTAVAVLVFGFFVELGVCVFLFGWSPKMPSMMQPNVVFDRCWVNAQKVAVFCYLILHLCNNRRRVYCEEGAFVSRQK